jgi:kynurenine formamidase
MRKPVCLVALLLAAACSSAPPEPPPTVWPETEIVDLSHAFDETTVFWPTAEPFRLETVSQGLTPAGFYYAANNFCTSEHGGTHLDAPRHFADGQWTVEQIPIERLIGPAAVVDVAARAEGNADYQITVDDLQEWEREHGEFPEDAIVLLRTGFSSRWPDAAQYLGTAERGQAGAANLHFPGLHPDAARWLATERQIGAVGIDTASIDFGPSTQFESHRILFAQNIPALENLTGLERVPAQGALVAALPMKIGGGSGAPLRAVALVPVAPAPVAR